MMMLICMMKFAHCEVILLLVDRRFGRDCCFVVAVISYHHTLDTEYENATDVREYIITLIIFILLSLLK
jgi:hypothetical protein